MRTLILFLAINFCFICSYSQDMQLIDADVSESIKQNYENANFEIESNNDYDKAAYYLTLILDEDPKYVDALQLLSKIYLFQKKSDLALKHLQTLREVDPQDLEYMVLYAKVLYTLKKFPKAKSVLSQIEAYSTDSTSMYSDYAFVINLLKGSIELSETAKLNPKEINKKPVEGVNTPLNEYFPTLTVDEQTLMVTRKIKSKKMDRVYGVAENEDIYFSQKKEGKWGTLQHLSDQINSPVNEGAQSLSSDGRTLYFTSSGRPDNLGSTDIYMSQKMEDGSWSEVVNLGPNVNSPKWDSQPCISNDGRYLYFVSDRPGGSGKADIWVSEKINGEWQEAKPLPKVINTPEVEYTPFISFDGNTMYFASDGHPTLGGLDLFVTTKDSEGNWSKPINMGYPINSEGQQVGIFVAADGSTAYYAENKSDNSDIYTFILPEEFRSKVTSFVKGKVFDLANKNAIATTIKLIDSKTKKNILVSQSDNLTGEYLISLPVGKQYTLIVEQDDYFKFSKNFKIDRENYKQDKTIDIALKPSEQPVEVNLAVVDVKSKQALQPNITVKTLDGQIFYQSVASEKGLALFELEPKTGYTLELSMKGYFTKMQKIDATSERELNINMDLESSVSNFNLVVFNLDSKSPVQSDFVLKEGGNIYFEGSTDDMGKAQVKLEKEKEFVLQINKNDYLPYSQIFKIKNQEYSLDAQLESKFADVSFVFDAESSIDFTIKTNTDTVQQQVEVAQMYSMKFAKDKIYELSASATGYKPFNIKEFKSNMATNGKFEIAMSKVVEENVNPVEKALEQPKQEAQLPAEVDTQSVVEEKPAKEPVLKEENFEFYYKFASTKLISESVKLLKSLDLTGESYNITAFTDTTGDAEYNLNLSKLRANAIKALLVKMGIAAEKIQISWKGESEKYKLKSKNRRAEIFIKKYE